MARSVALRGASFKATREDHLDDLKQQLTLMEEARIRREAADALFKALGPGHKATKEARLALAKAIVDAQDVEHYNEAIGIINEALDDRGSALESGNELEISKAIGADKACLAIALYGTLLSLTGDHKQLVDFIDMVDESGMLASMRDEEAESVDWWKDLSEMRIDSLFELGQDDDALDNLWAYTDQMNAMYPPTSDEFINHALDVLDFISGRELDAEVVADDFDVHVLSPIEAGLDEDSRMLASEVFDEVPEQFKKEMQLMHSYNELTREELVLNMHYVLRLPLDEGTVDDILAGFNEAKSFFDEYREDGGLPAIEDKAQEVLDSKLNDLADAIDKLADAYSKCPSTLTDDEVGVVLDALEPVMDKFEDFNELRAEALSILTNILRSYMDACDEDGWDEGDEEEAWDEDEDDDDFIQADEDDEPWNDDGK